MFGESAGKQCACCSLYAISFTAVKSPGHWNSDDIDFIVKEGDNLYKSLNKNTYLMVPDLPEFVPMFESQVKVTYLENEYDFLSISTILRFLSCNDSTNGDGLLFFIKGICVSIIWREKCVYLIESHSRNHLGQITPNGFSVLIKF